MKRISLKLKVSLIVAASTLLLTALLMVLSYREYSSVVDEHYNTLAMDIARTAASLVDGDQVAALRREVYDIYEENPRRSLRPRRSGISISPSIRRYRTRRMKICL